MKIYSFHSKISLILLIILLFIPHTISCQSKEEAEATNKLNLSYQDFTNTKYFESLEKTSEAIRILKISH